MSNQTLIKVPKQNKDSVAWKKLCDYIERVAESESEKFAPSEELGELFDEIYTLPESIAKLKKVKKVWLYGSQLKSIPPEIGEMESLEYFDPYTSYSLHWFPYEITNCKKLKDSRVSTRVLYGNFKNRLNFPSLENNPVRYSVETVKCSICKKEISYMDTNQLWISKRIGTDILPLLVNLCSKECENQLPIPETDYVSFAHKGGNKLVQPPDLEQVWKKEKEKTIKESNPENSIDIKPIDNKKDNSISLLQLIKKIWERR